MLSGTTGMDGTGHGPCWPCPTTCMHGLQPASKLQLCIGTEHGVIATNPKSKEEWLLSGSVMGTEKAWGTTCSGMYFYDLHIKVLLLKANKHYCRIKPMWCVAFVTHVWIVKAMSKIQLAKSKCKGICISKWNKSHTKGVGFGIGMLAPAMGLGFSILMLGWTELANCHKQAPNVEHHQLAIGGFIWSLP